MISAIENLSGTKGIKHADDQLSVESAPATTTSKGSPSSPGFSFEVPEIHAEFFSKRVADDERGQVRKLLSVLSTIYKSGRVNPTIRRLAPTLQMNFSTLRRQYYAYTRGCEKAGQIYEPGDWRSILNWTKVRSEKANLPFAFLEFWRTLGEQNQRKWKPAWDELMQVLRTGHDFKGKAYKKIPGFDVWPATDAVLGHPAGMSYENLMRHTSTNYDQMAARIGRSSATQFRIPVLKTRTQLRIGQFIECDDHVFDEKVLFQKKPMRPLAFGAVDVLTDCLFKLGSKPTLWDEVEEVKRTLTEREALWFILSVLCGTGYRRDSIGTTFNLERGCMTVREPYLSRLLAALGGHVKIYFGSNAGNNTRAAHAGQFGGQPKGNFRTKAIVESKWNPLNNQLASLLGQVGMDRDHSPAQLYGAEKYTGQLMRQAEAKGVALAELKLPFHSYHEWCRFAFEAVQRINTTRDHKCEGWEKLGFVKKFWRTDEASPLWLEEKDFALLSDMDRAIVASKLKADDGRLTKIERAHRWEVFQSLRRELTQLPMFAIPEIVGPEFALRSARGGEQMLTVTNGLLSFQSDEIDPDPIHFYARHQDDPAGHFIPNGEQFICFANPYLPTHLIACDEKLRVKAICPRYERAHDQASLERNMGAQGAMEAAQRVRLNLRHDDESRRKSADRQHNAALLAETGLALNPKRSTNDSPSDCTTELLARESALEQTPTDGWA
ncbi:MAG TPA: hypothetical protein VNN22_07990 [Verrucomicrobiae bacterium]|nr:hypothetical protein [Verrucomicrobiae bacterium]